MVWRSDVDIIGDSGIFKEAVDGSSENLIDLEAVDAETESMDRSALRTGHKPARIHAINPCNDIF